MNRSAAFFNVDTQQPSEDASGLIYRPRVQPLSGKLDRLLAFARAHDIVVVATACVNAGSVQGSLEPDGAFVSIDGSPGSFESRLHDYRTIFLEKRTCGSPAANVRERAYDVFHANPNAARVVRALGATDWFVFGDSVGYCFRSTVEGLLELGLRVTVLSDVVGKGIDTDAEMERVLAALEARGARLMPMAEALAGLS